MIGFLTSTCVCSDGLSGQNCERGKLLVALIEMDI